MSFLSNSHANRFLLWWHSSYANLQCILPLFSQNLGELESAELRLYQNLVHETSMRVQRELCPKYATELQAQLIAALCNLQMSLDAIAAANENEAQNYFHLARVKWVLLQAALEKHGVRVK